MNTESAFVFTSNCHTPSIMFQKVRVTSGEAFLIKDRNGYCAELSENKNSRKLYTTWKYCVKGGFTILEMSREGMFLHKNVDVKFQVKNVPENRRQAF